MRIAIAVALLLAVGCRRSSYENTTTADRIGPDTFVVEVRGKLRPTTSFAYLYRKIAEVCASVGKAEWVVLDSASSTDTTVRGGAGVVGDGVIASSSTRTSGTGAAVVRCVEHPATPSPSPR